MTKISNFIKRFKISTIVSSLLIATLFLAMIAGVAMAFQEADATAKTIGLTHTAYGLTTLILSAVTIVALIAYLVAMNFLPAIKQWRGTDAGIVTTTVIFAVLLTTILALMSVALALH